MVTPLFQLGKSVELFFAALVLFFVGARVWAWVSFHYYRWRLLREFRKMEKLIESFMKDIERQNKRIQRN